MNASPGPAIDPTLQTALEEHRAGRWGRAKEAYEAVLVRRPDDPDALLLFARLLQQTGDSRAAAAVLERLLAVAPSSAAGHYLLGQVYRARRRLPEAYGCYSEALRCDPEHAEARFSLGTLYCEREQWREAAQCFREVIRARPDYAEAHCNLGTTLQECRDFDAALACYHEAIRLKPDYYEAHYNLGNAHKEMGQLGLAIGKFQDALRLDPNFVPAHGNLGVVLQERGDLAAAESSFAEALGRDPRYVNARNGLGLVLAERGALDGAIAHYRAALRLKPDFPEAHLNLALALLLKGQLREGWEEYEWRWRSPSRRSELRHTEKPQWGGEPIRGKTIVLYYEQGLGDTIQFARFALVLARLGARVLLEVEAPVHDLMRESFRGIETFVKDEALPPFDYQCPLLSVPRALGIELATTPAEIPYLSAEPQRAARWRERLGVAHGPRIGIVWAGSDTHRYDRNRSVPLETIAPLFEVASSEFVTLQKGPAAAQLQRCRARVIDHTNLLVSFADTAALVACLDLVITVDTAVAHLAGAMGKPVWMLTPFAPDWRWLLEREDTPWYPSLRLFRQLRPDDWSHVIERIRTELADLCGRARN